MKSITGEKGHCKPTERIAEIASEINCQSAIQSVYQGARFYEVITTRETLNLDHLSIECFRPMFVLIRGGNASRSKVELEHSCRSFVD